MQQFNRKFGEMKNLPLTHFGRSLEGLSHILSVMVKYSVDRSYLDKYKKRKKRKKARKNDRKRARVKSNKYRGKEK